MTMNARPVGVPYHLDRIGRGGAGRDPRNLPVGLRAGLRASPAFSAWVKSFGTPCLPLLDRASRNWRAVAPAARAFFIRLRVFTHGSQPVPRVHRHALGAPPRGAGLYLVGGAV